MGINLADEGLWNMDMVFHVKRYIGGAFFWCFLFLFKGKTFN